MNRSLVNGCVNGIRLADKLTDVRYLSELWRRTIIPARFDNRSGLGERPNLPEHATGIRLMIDGDGARSMDLPEHPIPGLTNDLA
jgi:hypothetical protein